MFLSRFFLLICCCLSGTPFAQNLVVGAGVDPDGGGEWCSSTTQGVVSLKLYQTGRGLLQLDLMPTVTFGRAQECTSNLRYQNGFC